jgi:hypothetical protein
MRLSTTQQNLGKVTDVEAIRLRYPIQKKLDASRLALATACPTIVSPGRTESANPGPNDCVCKERLISFALLFMKRRINTDTKRLSKSYIKIRKPPIADSKGRAYGTQIKAVAGS